jgi:SNF2 family DNA or RNA helicase
VNVSASDVVGVEFKGRTSVQGQAVSSKPSEAIADIEFNRFPLEPWLVLRAPAAGQGARCAIVLRSRDGNIDIESFPHDGDQILAENGWYPVATSLLSEIDLLLSDSKAATGPITLKQYLHLARSASPRLIFAEVFEAIAPASPVDVATAAHQFKGTLYAYQVTGVRWIQLLANEELGGILGDEMGLGKTVQVIAALTNDTAARPNLIVAPATLLENWRREFVKFAPGMKVAVHRGGGRTGFPSMLRAQDVVITSYDTAVRDLALLKMVPWHFVILDEAQAIKNADTRRARSVRQIPKRTGLAVTGTPIENRLEDLWSILDFTCPGILGPLGAFRNRFENTVPGAIALQPAVSPLLLRRRVAEVAADLPERIDIPVAIEMPGVEVTGYERLRQAIVDEYGATATLVALTKLREFCTHPFVLDPVNDDPAAHSAKYLRLIEILDEIVEARDKVILFTSFQRMIDLAVRDVERRFGIPCLWIDGRTPVDDRQDIVDRFSDLGGSALLVLNPRAAGTGLNIVAANHVIHYNLEWNPAVEDQASARAHRRGQRRPVTVHRLFYASTVEEIIDQRVSLKRQLAAAAVVGTVGAEDLSDVAAALRLSPAREFEA